MVVLEAVANTMTPTAIIKCSSRDGGKGSGGRKYNDAYRDEWSVAMLETELPLRRKAWPSLMDEEKEDGQKGKDK